MPSNSFPVSRYDISTAVPDSSPGVLQDMFMPRQQLLQVDVGHQQQHLCSKPGKPLSCQLSSTAGRGCLCLCLCCCFFSLPQRTIACCLVQGGGYLATPTIPVSVINMHRDTTAESAVHDPAPACKGSRALSTSVNAVIGSGPSSLDPTPETTNTSVESHWLQASRSHTMHSNEDDGHDACTADSSSLAVCFYQYHIVYLPSYSVPVLLFKAYNEGKYNLHVATMLSQMMSCHGHCSYGSFHVAVYRTASFMYMRHDTDTCLVS